MANLASALKEEISRLARKEIRQQTAGTAKTVAQCEREIATLKRQIDGLQRMLSAQRTQGTPGPSASTKTGRKKVAEVKQPDKTAPDANSKRARFSAQALKTHRERLGLSADAYGKLIGVSGLSIYNWEQEKARPRDSSIAALMSIRGLGKREAARRLGEPAAAPQAKAKAKAKTTTRTTAKTKAKAKTATKAARPAKEAEAGAAEQDVKES